ncbi:MAG: cytochrome c oxidase assembly protein [Phycisphaerales bacterium]|nr:cytochrome c oxidase assembly protein [Phycisphaerales bacterium]
MPESAATLLTSWTVDPFLTLALVCTAAVYLRGWLVLRRSMPERYGAGRLACFMAGLLTIFVALCSPLDPMGGLLLSAHMAQHVLLMMVAPPLLLCGWPGPPLLRGLPWRIRSGWVGPLIGARPFRAVVDFFVHPLVAFTLFVIATWVWHLPALYELALLQSGWHEIEHGIFLFVSVLFWWPVIQPWPSTARWPRWMLIPYLLAADIQNTVFSAAFTFWTTPIYDLYAGGPMLLGFTPLSDQSAAGALMWVAGSAAFLLPVGWILVQLLSPRLARLNRTPQLANLPRAETIIHLPLAHEGGGPAPTRRRRTGDLFDTPLIGRLLASGRARRCVQWVLLLLALAIVVDGLLGPRLSPMNLAGVLPWTHWRGFVVLALLLAGNLFCWSCPFMLPRALAKRLRLDRLTWPQMLRSKWLAVGLLVVFLWSYEALALWDSPWWTAWIIIGYFVAVFAIDCFFRGASFCKWVCPIGQFHFVESMCSPREVAVRDESVCRTCTTHECIRGNDESPGCETGLYLPAKRGGLDCTWCMQCVKTCPHDNIGLLPRPLGDDLVHHGWRGGVGRALDRPDIIALVGVLTFGAFANAIGMTGPVLAMEDALQAHWGLSTHILPATIVVLALSVLLPAMLLPLIGLVGVRIGGRGLPARSGAGRLAMALAPLGFAMWLVHMLFHLLTSLGTIVPVTQRAMGDVGLSIGHPDWVLGCCLSVPDWLVPLEVLLLDAGLIVSLLVLHRAAGQIARGARQWAVTLIWSLLAVSLWALGVWIVLQPMQMRGTLLP